VGGPYTIQIGTGRIRPLAGSAGNFVTVHPAVAVLLLVQPTFSQPTGDCAFWRGVRGVLTSRVGTRCGIAVVAKAGAGDGGGVATVGARDRDSLPAL